MTSEERTRRLGSARLIPLILVMSAPAICGNLSNAFYSIISRAFLGKFVSRAALGAIGLIFPLNNLIAALSVMITIGGAALISLSLGAGDRKRADAAFTNILMFSAAASAVISLIYFLFAEQLVHLCGADETSALFAPAVQYLRISAFGHIFQVVNQTAASAIRAEGNTLYSMVVSVLGNFVNVGLGALFIVLFGWGVRGAALATLFSQCIGAVCSLSYFVRKKSVVRWCGLRALAWRQVGQVLSMGLAPAIFQGLSFFTNLLINNALMRHAPAALGAGGGDLAIAAVSVIATVENVALMIIMGMNNGISSIISYNYGAKNYPRVRRTSLVGQALASAAAAGIWALMMFTPSLLFSLFSSSGDVAILAYGAMAVRKSKLFMLFVGFQTLSSMYYSAIGKPRVATFISICRNGLFLIPALLVLPRFFGLDGVLYSTAVSDVCSVAVVGVIYLVGMRDLRRKARGLPKGAQAPGAAKQMGL
ncbi:MAG: MATE family efflux transporter [Oscillospiraceae bacterium]|jgi:putative MATE family efflux protein|nr:MATE family efflux transporter [Oscillospiraceae bacterium]